MTIHERNTPAEAGSPIIPTRIATRDEALDAARRLAADWAPKAAERDRRRILPFDEIAAFSAPLSGPALTMAVRRPESSECRTQPSVPSESRIRRQVSNSPTISTGRPARWNTHRVR